MGLLRLTARDAGVAIGGAVLLAAATAAINFQAVQANPLEMLLLPAVAGFIIGWIYGMAWDLYELVNQAQKQMKELTLLADHAIGPLTMLLKAQRHAPALGALIKDSIVNKHIAYVSTNKYLSYLNIAVRNSDMFYGLQRNPLRWFMEQPDRADYLQNLRAHKMRQKRRIVIIDSEQAMIEDLANQQLMAFYWKNTGDDVRTFWISEQKFSEENRDLPVPRDFALYDQELLIQYDDKLQTVKFDHLGPDAVENRIFKQLDDQLRNNSSKPYIEIRRQPDISATPSNSNGAVPVS